MFPVGESIEFIFDMRIIFMGMFIEEPHDIFIGEEDVCPSMKILFQLCRYVCINGLFSGLYTDFWNGTTTSLGFFTRSFPCLSLFASIFLRGPTSAP